MIAVAGVLVSVIGWQRTRDPQEAGHNQGAVDLGGHALTGLQVHAPRVAKTQPVGATPPLESMPANRLHAADQDSGPLAEGRLARNLPETTPRSATHSTVSLQSATAVELR